MVVAKDSSFNSRVLIEKNSSINSLQMLLFISILDNTEAKNQIDCLGLYTNMNEIPTLVCL